jgi:hypothetical protein
LSEIEIARRHEASTAALRNLLLGAFAMMDVVMLALAFLFFTLSIAYVYACDRL